MSGPRHFTVPFGFGDWVTINGDDSLRVQVIAYEFKEAGMSAQVLWINEGKINQEWVPVSILKGVIP